MVKTRGRMVNGVLQPGVGIPGAIVQVKDRTAVMSESNGRFSFPLQSNTFSLLSVKKQGYQLVDMEACRSYKSTSDPIYLVMETPEQQQADLVATERKLRRTLQRQLQGREEEIDALKVSMEEKNRLLAELYKKQENNEKLIAGMAKEYAALDYDQMDALNQRISDAILNGRLTEADSLLRSKGDIRSRVAQIKKEQQAEQIREDEILREKETLAASRKGTMKKVEDVANDCYRLSELCLISYQLDSMAYYLMLRAELDTTNASWQFEAAYRSSDFNNSKKYYDRVIRLTQDNQNGNNLYLYATALNNIGALYQSNGDFINAEIYFKKGIDGRRTYAKQSNNPIEWNHVAWSLVSLSSLYDNTNRYDDSEWCLHEATMIYDLIAPVYYDNNEYSYGRLYDQWGWYYLKTKNYKRADSCYIEAWKNFRISTKHITPEMPSLSSMKQLLIWGLAEVYDKLNRNDEIEDYYIELRKLYKKNLHINPPKLQPEYASLLVSFSNYYFEKSPKQYLKEREDLYKEYLQIYRRLAQQDSSAYAPDLSVALHNMAIFYYETQRIAESETAFKEALEIDRRLAYRNPSAYESDVAATLNNLATLCDITQRSSEAEAMYEEALEIRKRLAASNPSDYNTSVAVVTLGNMSHCKILQKKYAESEQYSREGLAIDSTQHWITKNLAAALLFQGKYNEAEQIYCQHKSELKDSILDDFNKFAEAGVIPPKYEADVEKIKKMLNDD